MVDLERVHEEMEDNSMWTVFHWLQAAAYFAIVVLFGYWVYDYLWPEYLERWWLTWRQAPDLQGSGRTIDRERAAPKGEKADPAQVESCEPLTIDMAKAGQVISDVPEISPAVSGKWKADRTVVATAFAKVFTPQGSADTTFLFLSGDILLIKTPRKWRILTELPTSRAELTLLGQERKFLLADDAAGKTTDIDEWVDNFRGCRWLISGVYGKNRDGKQSTIELTSLVADVSQFQDDLPSAVLRRAGDTVAYYDMRLDWDSGSADFTGQCAWVMWMGEDAEAVVYAGRDLTEAEVRQMGLV